MRGIERCRTRHADAHRTTPTPRARHKRRRGAVDDGVTYNFKYSFPSAPTGGPSRQCPRGRGDTWRGDPITAVPTPPYGYARNATFCTGRNRYDGGTKHSDHRSHRYDNSYNAAAIDVHRAALSIGRLCAGFHRAQDVLPTARDQKRLRARPAWQPATTQYRPQRSSRHRE